MTDTARPLLTLEPLIEAVQDGITRTGWVLSGLQKTTSHQFEGRWQGEDSRSAYLFFHQDEGPDLVSIDVFLDETSKGLKGNLALVVSGPELELLEPMPDLLAALAKVTADCPAKNAAHRRSVFVLPQCGHGIAALSLSYSAIVRILENSSPQSRQMNSY